MTTDFVYAGDLQGNMWKFDLSSASSGSWTVALGGQPLFAALEQVRELAVVEPQE